MLKLVKYLKPFWLSVILLLGLLFAQAQCELALPSYMSDIVTNGIQYGGITDSALQEVRADELDKMMIFMDEDEIKLIHENYTESQKTLSSNEVVSTYVLNDVSSSIKNEIGSVFAKPLIIVKTLNNPEIMDKMGMPEGTDIFAVLKIDPVQFQQTKDLILAQAEMMTANIPAQAAIMFAKQEYETLGLDILPTDTALEEVSTDTYDKLLLFMSDEDKTLVSLNYSLVEDRYVLGEVSDEVRQQIGAVLTKPLIKVSALSSPEVSAQLGLSDGMSVFTLLQFEPISPDSIEDAVMSKVAALGDTMITPAANMMAKQEYQSLELDTHAMQQNYIMNAGIKMLAISLFGAICAIIVGFLSSKIATGLSRNLRNEVFTRVESFSTAEFNKFSTASLITRTTNDVQQVQQALTMILRIIVYAPIMGIGAILKVMNTNRNMVWIIALVVVLILSVMFTTIIVAMPKFKIAQTLTDRLNLVVREFLSGMPVIRAFNTEKHEELKFNEANKNVKKTNLFINRTISTIMPIVTFIMSSTSLLIVWFGSQYIDMGTLQIGDMMAFLQYSMQIIMSFMMVAMIIVFIPQASVSANRILEVIETEPSILDPKEPKKFDDRMSNKVVFDHVSFKYPGAEANVLENINFTSYSGEVTAFIGSTGSGKSTVVNLIPRFFDVTEGRILIDDIDIRDVTQNDLRDLIGYVPQKGILFSGDIESNLRYAKEEASDEAIQQAIEVSQAKEFISTKEDGIKSAISQGGTNVSGGQRQRLSIARALTKEAKIYIFDDSFSALDFKTDSLLREALNKMIKKTRSTVFIVGQRISTIMNADQIVVLDQGKIAGIGKHEYLMKTCDVYKEIALSQLSKEELGHE